jgi:urease accessory protein
MNTVIATLTQKLPVAPESGYQDTVRLMAEERRRSRYHCQTISGKEILIALSRGVFLQSGDYLTTAEQNFVVLVEAQPEPVLMVKGKQPLDLLRAAYHLGNRHVALAITPDTLTLAPDSVLQEMLHHLGLDIVETVQPFEPETGAYGHTH